MRSRLTILLTLIALASGLCCTPRSEIPRNEAVKLHESRGCVVAVLLDLSGSFQDKLIEDGTAHAFFLAVVEEYSRGRIGENDELIIGQISAGSTPALVWQGTPMQLRQDF